MEDAFQILIVDDEPNIRSGLAKGLQKYADRVDTAGSVNEALDKFQAEQHQLVIADIRLPGDRDGLELVSIVKQLNPGTTTIVITAHGTVDTAVDALRRGAFDFITKPVDLNLIRQQVGRAVEHHKLQHENHQLKERLAEAGEVTGIIGNCRTLKELLAQIRQVADTDATVLIQGESGSGKELIARAIHDLSHRSQGPFLAVNLGALPETLLESELFGHEKGSFTGASRQKPGCFEQSANGTLFLDEITEIPSKCQVDLLRVLETGRFARIGGEGLMESDARIVSATNRDIRQMVDEGTFREDLFYRLNIVPILVPPLRERREDIPLLIDHFLTHFCSRHRRDQKSISSDAMRTLCSSSWPGNIRQLRNVIERLVVTIPGDEIAETDLPRELTRSTEAKSSSALTLAEVTEAAEREAIQESLLANDFHREHTAKALGVSIRTLHYKMNRYGLH
ncbi:sigma-54 dependent transcriptional regulator [Stieleria sp. JC731]|uniref:sigma-54-dependent transcriptional regulator n=1 Tax=Pirellulaceae TaxID=2691357 RepID=UPI001E518DA7|nr:sigma-54 dependent transcriptional regulator [Stieleria sp. JC731]MCC9603259.1 sigma-54 dependent transcriptional regulator [Stieleria sp. JC731]